MGSTAGLMGLAGAGIGAAGSIAGGYAQSQALRSQGRYQERIAGLNARFSDIQAQDTLRRGDREAALQGARTRRLIGSQRAAYAAQGVDVNQGAPLDVQAESAYMGELDRQTIKYNAYLDAMGLRMQGANELAAGKFAGMAARNQARNTLLSSGLNAASQLGRGAYIYGANRPPAGVPTSSATYGGLSAPLAPRPSPYDRPGSYYA